MKWTILETKGKTVRAKYALRIWNSSLVQLKFQSTITYATEDHRRMNQGAQEACAPHFSQSIRQSAPLQLKTLPVFVYEGASDTCAPPYFLNASYVTAEDCIDSSPITFRFQKCHRKITSTLPLKPYSIAYLVYVFVLSVFRYVCQ